MTTATRGGRPSVGRQLVASAIVLGAGFVGFYIGGMAMLLLGPMLVAVALAALAIVGGWRLAMGVTGQVPSPWELDERTRRRSLVFGVGFLAVIAVACAAVWVAASGPWTDVAAAEIPVALISVAAAAYVLRPRRPSVGRVLQGWRARRWLAAAPAVLVVLLLVAVVLDVPFSARWALARDDFDAFIAERRTGPATVGGVPIGEVEYRGDQVWIDYEGHEAVGWMTGTDTRFAYLPHGVEGVELGEETTARPLGGGWYLVVHEWD